MSWEAIGGLITGVATAFAAVLVILQLRELNKQAKLAHFSDYTQRFNDIVVNFPEDIMSKDFVLAQRPDRDQLMRYFRRYLDLCFEEWFLHRRGLIANDIWRMWESGIKAGMGHPSIQQAWLIVKSTSTFDPAFIAFIDGLIASHGAGVPRT